MCRAQWEYFTPLTYSISKIPVFYSLQEWKIAKSIQVWNKILMISAYGCILLLGVQQGKCVHLSGPLSYRGWKSAEKKEKKKET